MAEKEPAAAALRREPEGIGVLNERTLHAFLKKRYGPDPACREVRVGRYITDILLPAEGPLPAECPLPGSIVEIQTRGFSALRAKLAFFLKERPVTVVYPVAAVKRLVWVEPGTGESAPPRKSPKKAGPWEIFYELVYLRSLLLRPGLRFRIVLLELDETRVRTARRGRQSSVRLDRIPRAVLGEVEAEGRYAPLLPPGLPEPFTAAELRKAGRMSPTLAGRCLAVLRATGEVAEAGRRGREKLWTLKGGEKQGGLSVTP